MDRVSVVEAGAEDRDAIRADQPKDEPLGLQFNNNGAPVGGMRLTLFPTGGIFKIQSVVDAQCQPVDKFFNPTDPGRVKMTPGNYNTLRLQFDNGSYNLNLGIREAIRIDFMPAV